VVLQLSDLEKRLENIGLALTYDTKVLTHIVTETYNPEYGARPVRRFIQDRIEDAIADTLVEKK
jgi:ATP-dependent Clp protease ATP-binding subunit ClpE